MLPMTCPKVPTAGGWSVSSLPICPHEREVDRAKRTHVAIPAIWVALRVNILRIAGLKFLQPRRLNIHGLHGLEVTGLGCRRAGGI